MSSCAKPDDLTAVVALLWGEIPLSLERRILERLRREGLYQTWEAALDAQMMAK